jgi:RNA polymerase sigma factor (sigma-70 family)
MSARLRSWFRDFRPAAAPDGELVARFVRLRDEEAFAELVRRHGPMVLATCRRALHPDAHAADDAFQAAFLVLATKAGAVRPPGRVGAWLHGVAVRVARRAKAWVRKVAPLAPADLDRVPAAAAEPDPDLAGLRAAIDDVLAGLPARYRSAVVLCDLEGRSRAEAAGALGWSEGTLSGRLARARKLLADRLARRGFAPAAAGLAVAAVPPSLAAAVVKAAALVAAGAAAAEVASGPVARLTHGGPAAMKPTLPVLAVAAAVGLALGGLSRALDPDPPASAVVARAADEKPAPREEWAPAHAWTFPSKVTTVALGAEVAVAGDRVGTLAVFDLKAGKEREKLREGTDGGGPPGVERVQLSPDGKTVYLVLESGGFHQTTVERKGREWHGVAGSDRWHTFGVTPDGGHWLQTVNPKRGTLYLIVNDYGKPRAVGTIGAQLRHDDPVKYVAVGGDGAVATVANGILRRWKPGDDGPPWAVTLNKLGATGVAAGGGLVAVLGGAGEVRLFSAKTGNVVGALSGHDGPVRAAAFSPDGKRLVTGGEDGTARVWDPAALKELAVLKGGADAVTAVAFGPDGDALAVAADKAVRVWRLKK